jgi:hypothetical protein
MQDACRINSWPSKIFHLHPILIPPYIKSPSLYHLQLPSLLSQLYNLSLHFRATPLLRSPNNLPYDNNWLAFCIILDIAHDLCLILRRRLLKSLRALPFQEALGTVPTLWVQLTDLPALQSFARPSFLDHRHVRGEIVFKVERNGGVEESHC